MGPFRKIERLFSELRRRRVIRVAVIYVLTAAAVAQAADVMLPRLGLPDWTVTLVVALFALGFPLAAALAWAFDVTPEGVRRADPENGEARGTGVWAGGAVIVLVGVGVGVWWVGAGPNAPAADDDVDTGIIAVLPFSFSGGEQYAYLGTGMVDLLTTKLDGAGSLRAVGPRAVLGLVRQAGSSTLDDAAAHDVSARLGAGLYILGQVVEVNGRLHLSAAVYSRAGGEPVQASVEGQAEQIFSLVDDLAAQLLSELAGGPGSRVTRVAAATTHSLPALRAYLEGEELLRGGHFPSALESFRRAIAEDSTFALAYYRLSIAAEWSGSPETTPAAEQAYRRSDRLSEHDRRLVEAMLAWRRGNGDEAERLYRAIVGAYPDDVEAWFQLAEVLFHYDPWRGGSVARAREPFERVLFYEPDHVTSLWHLARIAAVEQDIAEMDSLVRRVQALSPEGDRTLELLAMRAFGSGDSTGMGDAERQLRGAIDLTRYMAVWNVAAYARDVHGAHRLARVLTDSSRALEVRATGHLLRAHLDVARGRPVEAARELAAAARFDPAAGLLHEAVLALHPALPQDRARMRAVLDRLDVWNPAQDATSRPAVIYFNPATNSRVEARGLLIGMLNARLGDRAKAETAAAGLLAGMTESGAAGLAQDYTRVIRSEIALAAGDTAAALAQLEQVRGEVLYSIYIQSLLASQPFARFRRAELLEATGRLNDALTLYGTFDELSAYDMSYEGVAALGRARIHERLGDTERAAVDYRVALRLWADAEPGYESLVGVALAGAARTGGDRTSQ